MRILLFHTIFISLVTFGQTQKVTLVIQPQVVEVGEVFTITVTSSVQGSLEVDNLPRYFIQDYSIHQGSSQEMDHSTGIVRNKYFTTYSGQITKAGTYNIGPAYVKAGSKTYTSSKVEVKVVQKANMICRGLNDKQLKDPAFGVIESNKKEIYEGEAILLSSKIYSYYDPSHISSYQSYTVSGASTKYPIGSTTNIKVGEERIKGRQVYAFQYDKNIVFPDAVGSFTVEPFQVNLHQGYKSFPITSASLKLNVKPLPANPPSEFIGAVGRFDLIGSIDQVKLKQGDVFTFELNIEGTGNLQNLEQPKLQLPKGFSVYGDPVTEEDFSITSNGAEGSVRYTYHIQVKESGSSVIFPEVKLAYFDPKKESYVYMSTDEYALEVEANKHYIAAKHGTGSTKTEVLVKQPPKDKKSEKRRTPNKLTPLLWGGVSIPVLAGFFILLYRRRKNPKGEKINQAISPDLNFKQQIRQAFIEIERCIVSRNLSGYQEAVLNLLRLHTAWERGDRSGSMQPGRQEIVQFINNRFPGQVDVIQRFMNQVETQKFANFGEAPPDIEQVHTQLDSLLKQLQD